MGNRYNFPDDFQISRIEPFLSGQTVAVIEGSVKTWAVELAKEVGKDAYVVISVCRWSAAHHLGAWPRIIYQVAADDEIGAYARMVGLLERMGRLA